MVWTTSECSAGETAEHSQFAYSNVMLFNGQVKFFVSLV